MSATETNRCGHTACGCRPAEPDFCGTYCANVQAHETDDAACACGHRACAEAQRVPSRGGAVAISLGRGPGSQATTNGEPDA